MCERCRASISLATLALLLGVEDCTFVNFMVREEPTLVFEGLELEEWLLPLADPGGALTTYF